MNVRALLARAENPFMSPSMGFGSPLPRSFKHPGHGKRPCEPFYGLLMAYLGLSTPGHEKRRYGLFWGLSGDVWRLLKKPLLGLSWVWGNSRARILASIWGNQTRLCRTRRFSHEVLLGRALSWASFAAIVGLPEGAEVNFLFVSSSGEKIGSKRPILRGLLFT